MSNINGLSDNLSDQPNNQNNNSNNNNNNNNSNSIVTNNNTTTQEDSIQAQLTAQQFLAAHQQTSTTNSLNYTNQNQNIMLPSQQWPSAMPNINNLSNTAQPFMPNGMPLPNVNGLTGPGLGLPGVPPGLGFPPMSGLVKQEKQDLLVWGVFVLHFFNQF